jgi:hypothetical protein
MHARRQSNLPSFGRRTGTSFYDRIIFRDVRPIRSWGVSGHIYEIVIKSLVKIAHQVVARHFNTLNAVPVGYNVGHANARSQLRRTYGCPVLSRTHAHLNTQHGLVSMLDA